MIKPIQGVFKGHFTKQDHRSMITEFHNGKPINVTLGNEFRIG